MKIRTTFALAIATLTIGASVAQAEPGGPYQPQAEAGVQADVIDRNLRANAPDVPPDAVDRYLRNHTARDATVAAPRPDTAAEIFSVASEGRDWTMAALGALGGGFFAFLAIVGASAIRERRRLVV